MDKSILIVEDDATLRELLSEILEFEGYEVITATDGLDALEKIEDRQPMLMGSDIRESAGFVPGKSSRYTIRRSSCVWRKNGGWDSLLTQINQVSPATLPGW